MIICPHCKSEQEDGTKFCTKCGMRLMANNNEDNKEEMSNNEATEDKKEDVTEEKKVEESSHEENSEKNESNESEKSEDKKEEVKDEEKKKDPFAYNFSDKKNKKSSDGIWLAIIAIVVVVAIIIIGTSKKKENSEEALLSTEIEQSSEEDQKDEAMEKDGEAMEKEGEPEEAMIKEELPNYTVEASSTLTDNTGNNFDYSPSQVVDRDFSTAWIEAKEDDGIGESITVKFDGEKEISKLGIVPGYGRDAVIYKQNNRVKKLTLEFSDGSTIEKELEDKYAMHILEFDQKKTSSVKITINEVYAGSVFKDTSIAEIDVDSDYVKNNDPVAAMRYYEENKKASAKYPRK